MGNPASLNCPERTQILLLEVMSLLRFLISIVSDFQNIFSLSGLLFTSILGSYQFFWIFFESPGIFSRHQFFLNNPLQHVFQYFLCSCYPKAVLFYHWKSYFLFLLFQTFNAYFLSLLTDLLLLILLSACSQQFYQSNSLEAEKLSFKIWDHLNNITSYQ